jgi:hypothetical protein
VKKIRQVNGPKGTSTAAREPRNQEGEKTMKGHTLTRAAIAMVALVIPLIGGLTTATSASASTTPTLGLSSDAYDTWVVSGSLYTPGLSDVQLWVQDVTNGAWTTLEYQSGLDTSKSAMPCRGSICVYYRGGSLSAEGARYYVSVPPGGLGYPGYWLAYHTLQCGHSYQAVTDDPNDGWVYSNVLTEPACQTIS